MAKAKKKIQGSDPVELIKMCDDALLRKIGMKNTDLARRAMEELVEREQKNISK